MKKNYTSLLSASFIAAIIFLVFYSEIPHYNPDKNAPLSAFSTKRALEHVREIAKQPHFVGSKNHQTVADYLENELTELGLKTQIQEGFTFTEYGNLVKSRNVLARLDGSDNSKALLLLSHYDSAPHTKSKGAADDASGVAVILESLRAFLHNKTTHKNDIIIVFSDAEEIGLNGAALFVKQHNWAKNIGLALNFEARGTSGPAYMLMEVTNGNASIVEEFSKSKVQHPATNSLMYSIYKMLPNDTDLTVFREEGKIQGLNFAFIDDHFNYHTQQDDFEHLNPDSVEHAGSYLIPLLNYFSNSDLTKLESQNDTIYFNIPFSFIKYPFSWVFPMLFVAIILFFGLLFVGFGKRILSAKEIGKGFVLFIINSLIVGVITFFGWKAILSVYPSYKEILHGFTYNGHSYVIAFIFLTLGISFFIYRKFCPENSIMNYSVAPLFLWIVINAGIAFALPGAGFFIIPVFAALIVFGYFIITQRTNQFLFVLLSVPALMVYIPFVVMFPVGLGLKMLFGAMILAVLTFSLLLPVFGSFAKKLNWSVALLLISIGFFVNAHVNSGFEYGKAKPNSLVYILDAEKNKAFWATYDSDLDEWTKNYLENPKEATQLNKNPLYSKYDSKFTLFSNAPLKEIPEPKIEFRHDTIIGNQRYLDILISPARNVNRYDIFADEKMAIHNLKANGIQHSDQKSSLYKRDGKKILSYYVVNNERLFLQFSINKNTDLSMDLVECSFDLMENPVFNMLKRPDWMMPKPFVLNDAIIIQKKIKPTRKSVPEIVVSNEN